VVLVHPKTLLGGDEEVAGFHWSLRGQPDFRGAAIGAGRPSSIRLLLVRILVARATRIRTKTWS